MNVILKSSKLLLNAAYKPNAIRTISLSPQLCLKEIRQVQKDKELLIYGDIVESPRAQYLLKPTNPHVCPVCSLGHEIKHTDVLILSQFVRSDGCMLPRRVTGLCKMQQKRLFALVTMAQKSGLMPNLAPSYSKKDPKLRFGWKKCNKYFDESTIKIKVLHP